MEDSRRAGLFGRAALCRGIYAISVKTQHSLGFEIVGVVLGFYMMTQAMAYFR